MPIVAGISLIKIENGSPVTVHLLSTTSDVDGNATKSSGDTFTQPILDVSDLSSTFSAIAAALPQETVQATLAVPSHIPESAHKPIARAAHKVRIFRTIWVSQNIQLVRKQLDSDPTNPNRYELFIEMTPDLAFARLEYTEEEDGIRSAEFLKEVSVSLPESSVDTLNVVAALVDPIMEVLKASPTPFASDIKNIIITGGDEPFLTALSTKVKASFVGGNIIFLPSDYAKYAAEHALNKYQDSLTYKDQAYITNYVPLRVGIAKADGFVLTALQRNSTMPQEKFLLLTTSTDNQTTATVKVVVGVSPVSKDNTPIAELVLKDLKARPRGETIIKISFSVEHLGKTTIIVEELGEEGTEAGGARTSIELEDVLGNDLFWDDVEDILEGAALLGENPAAMEAEDRWAGERAQGDLPQ